MSAGRGSAIVINPALLEWSKKLIACPSVTDRGTRAIVELCARELLAPAGINAQLLPSARCGSEQLNLIAIVPGACADAPPLVFNTHLDTVAPGDSRLWTACDGDPFKPSLSQGRIYGLGAADTKLDFAAKAIALVENHKPHRTVYLVATFGEESGLRGAKELADTGLLAPPGLTFVGEPSSLALITANRGLNVFRLVVEGQAQPLGDAKTVRLASFVGAAAHSSTPHLGRNAIESALRFLVDHPELQVVELAGGDAVNKVPALCQALVAGKREISLGETATPSGAAPLRPAEWSDSLNALDEAAAPREAGVLERAPLKGASRGERRGAVPVGMLRALLDFIDRLAPDTRQMHSAAPDSTGRGLTCNAGVIHYAGSRSQLEFELRQPPDISQQEVAGAVEAVVESFKREFPKLRFELVKLRANPGFRAAPMSETVALATRAMAQAGLEVATGEKAGCTEAGIYAAVGLQPVVFGPGPSTGVIHAPNEYNLVSEVEAAARVYRLLLHM